jgi:hypothetical protein
MRVTSVSWDGEKLILRDQVLEARNVDDRLHIARGARKPDERDAPIECYDPYGPGPSVSAYAGDEAIDDRTVSADADPVSEIMVGTK